jgi:hypothetical protein
MSAPWANTLIEDPPSVLHVPLADTVIMLDVLIAQTRPPGAS